MEEKISIKIDILILCILAVVITLVYFALPRLGLYSDDEGRKYTQMKAFYLNGYKDYDIKYPGRALGAGIKDLDASGHFVERNNKIYVSYYLPFSFLSSLFYPVLGDRVTHFLPLLTFFLSIIILSRILHLLKPLKHVYYILLFGFMCAAPVYPHSITFLEHVPAVFLTTAALYYLVRFFIGGGTRLNLSLAFVLLSLGTFLRPETIFLVGALYIPVFLYLWFGKEIKKIIPATACSAVIMLCYAFFNFRFYGRLFTPGPLTFAFSYRYFFLAAAGAGVIGALGFWLYKFFRDEKIQEFMIWLVAAGILFYLGGSTRRNIVNIFICSFPLTAIFLFDFQATAKGILQKKFDAKGTLLICGVLFLFFISLCVKNNPDQSARFLLPLVPIVFVFLCFSKDFMEKHKGGTWIVVILLIIGLTYNLHFLKVKVLKYKYFNAERLSFLKKNTKHNDVIIFTSPSLLSHTGPLFSERIYLFYDFKTGINEVLGKLKKAGVSRFYLAEEEGLKGVFLHTHRGYKVVSSRAFSTKSVKYTLYLFEVTGIQ